MKTASSSETRFREPKSRRLHRMRALIWVPAMLILPLAVACSGGSASPGVASVDATPTATGDGAATGSTGTDGGTDSDSIEDSVIAYSQCMRENGVTNFPDPDGDGNLTLNGDELGIPPDSPQFEAAEETCKQLLPNGGQPQAQPPEVREELLKFSQCMRDNGITNFPDPSADGGIALDGDAVDFGSPQFEAADEACKQYMPNGGEGGSTNRVNE